MAAAALLLSATLPAIAQDSASTDVPATGAEETTVSSASSSSAGSTQSFKNLGQTIKYTCMGLTGLERARCVRTAAMERRNALRRLASKITSSCSAFEVHSEDFRACLRKEAKEMKDAMGRQEGTPQHRMNRATRSATEHRSKKRGMMIRANILKHMQQSSSAASSAESGS